MIDETKPYLLFDPIYTWKKQTVENFEAVELRRKIFEKGKLIYDVPTVEQAREYCAAEVERLWDEVKRFENPHRYYVDLSEKLWHLRNDLLEQQKTKS